MDRLQMEGQLADAAGRPPESFLEVFFGALRHDVLS